MWIFPIELLFFPEDVRGPLRAGTTIASNRRFMEARKQHG